VVPRMGKREAGGTGGMNVGEGVGVGGFAKSKQIWSKTQKKTARHARAGEIREIERKKEGGK